MRAGAAALFFDFGEVGALVPVGFGVVIIRERVEARRLCDATGDDGVRHANNRGGVHAAAQLSENGTVGPKPAADGFGKERAEMLLVFAVCLIMDSLVGIELPILLNRSFASSQQYGTRRGNRVDTHVWRKVSRGEEREPACDVLLTQRKGSSGEKNERV